MLGGPVCIGFAEAWAAPETAASLVGAGFEVMAFSRDGARTALRRSKHVRVIPVTRPEQDVAQTAEDLRDAIRVHGISAVMPMDDFAIWLFDHLHLDDDILVLGPTRRLARFALDKRVQIAAATDAGLDVPPTRVADTPRELAGTAFPVVVKPAFVAERDRGRLVRGRTRVCADRDELDAVVSRGELRFPVLLQPFIEGAGEGLFGLVKEGHVSGWSAHRRLRLVDPEGSGASACVSRLPRPELMSLVERMLQDTAWHGLFMCEFLRAHDGRTWFMELNARPWGSLALARRLGFEYPAWALAQAIQPSFSVPPVSPYEGLVCRHLGHEVIHLLRVLRGPPSAALVNWPSRRQTLRSVARLDRTERWYNWLPGERAIFIDDTVSTLAEWVKVGFLSRLR